MPELPEVETVVRGLREPLIGRSVLGMWYDWPRTVRMPGPDAFAQRIVGQTFRAVNRRAKYILAELDHDLLVVHLKMSGRLYVAPNDAVLDSDKWVHFGLQLDGGMQLRFSDARKFGMVALVADFAEVTDRLGPEPLLDTFTPAVLRERLHKHKKAIKALLLDQSFVAGVGNIYADESLHRAGIHPLRAANGLTDDEVQRLYAAIRESLDLGIERQGASINWYRQPNGEQGSAQDRFLVYDREGEPCLTCGDAIVKTRVAQRGTHYCPHCQPLLVTL